MTKTIYERKLLTQALVTVSEGLFVSTIVGSKQACQWSSSTELHILTQRQQAERCTRPGMCF